MSKREPKQINKPGVYRDLTVAEYDAIPAVRRTFAWDIYNQSPGHAIYNSTHRKPKKAWEDGTMVHTSLLLPEEFPRQYIVQPPFEADPGNVKADGTKPSEENARRTGYYKDKVKMFNEMVASTGATVVDQRDYDMAYGIGKNVRDHPIASRFFKRGTSNEAVAVAVDPDTGLLMKARFDCLVVEGMPTGADVKTAASAHPLAFRYSIKKFGYYFQNAFYIRVLELNGLKAPNFLFIVGEKVAPYPVAVYELPADYVRLGQLHVSQALKRYKECTSAGKWPYYGDGIGVIEVSEFDLKELEEK